MKWLVEVWGYVKLYIGWKITSKHSGIFCYIPAFDSSIYVFIPGYEGDLWFHVPRGRAGAISSQIPTQHWLPRRPQQAGGQRDQYSSGLAKTSHGRGPGVLQGLGTNAILFLFARWIIRGNCCFAWSIIPLIGTREVPGPSQYSE